MEGCLLHARFPGSGLQDGGWHAGAGFLSSALRISAHRMQGGGVEPGWSPVMANATGALELEGPHTGALGWVRMARPSYSHPSELLEV